MKRRTALLLAVALLAAISGCAAANSDTSSTPTETPESPTSPSETPTATPESIGPLPEADNPWDQQVVNVTAGYESRADVNMTAVLLETVEYWNGEGSQYATYDVEFQYVEDTSDAQIFVKTVNQIQGCDHLDSDTTLGCAPLYHEDDNAGATTIIEIVPGLSFESTVTTTKHEFGHVLGLEHGDEPTPLMEARADVTRQPVPNATEREYPFRTGTIRIYSDAYPDATRDVIEHFNEKGNTPAPHNVSLSEAKNASAAHIVIKDGDCDELADGGSCGYHYGYDYDGHGELDWYTNATIEIEDVDDVDLVGWHIGYWTAKYVYNEAFDPFEPDSSQRERQVWN